MKILVSLTMILLLFNIRLNAQPLQNRLLIATSSDGLNWIKSGIVFAENGEVPDAIVRPDSKIAVYYQGLVNQYKDGIFVAVSDNGFDNWTRFQVILTGTENWSGQPCDPNIIFINGKYRLYFTGNPVDDKYPETYSAISDDGIHFTIENGIRFIQPNSPIMDPSLLMIGDTLHYFAGGASEGKNWHAISTDGLNFTRVSDFQVNNLMMANGLKVTDGYRFYCFSNNDRKNLYSIYSSDGVDWLQDSGVRLTLDNPVLEIDHIKDPAVVNKDSKYIMYYVAGNGISTEKDSATYFLKKYIMSFHTCTGIDCSNPKNHITKLAESDDLINWNLIANIPQMQGSVPDVIVRADKLYVYNPGLVRIFNNSSKKWEPSAQIIILDSNNNKVDFVDPSAFIDDNGKIVLFFLNSTGLVGQDPAGCKVYPCTKNFDSAIEEDASDGKRFRLVSGHRLTIELQNGTASDPDIFFDGKEYILYISRGSNTFAYHSLSLNGTYLPFTSLPNSVLTNAGGVACGFYDFNSKIYYTYVHSNENGTNIIKVATHQDFSKQLIPSEFKPAINGYLMGLGINANCESPGITQNIFKNQPSNNGPWNNPLKIAFSNDGINFNSEKIFQDSSGVPSAIKWKGDTLVCVFQWFRQPINSVTWDRVAVKFSFERGKSWTEPVPIIINGLPSNYQRPFDPTLVVLDNNKLRMYFSSGIQISQGLDSAINTYSAISSDGINYQFESSARYDNPIQKVIDPAVINFGNEWHYISPKGAPQDGAFHCTSNDGLIFSEKAIIPSDNFHNWTGNFMVDNSSELRFYGCGQNIWFNNSSDGYIWQGYNTTNLRGGDPTVVKIDNSDYLAIYVGEPYNNIGNFTCGDTLIDARDGRRYATVFIGSDCWMKQNLDFGQMVQSNISDIPHSDMFNNNIPEKYAMNNDTANLPEYGGLYEWDELMNYTKLEGYQGLCPAGWHISTDAEWQRLVAFSGGKLYNDNSGIGGNALKKIGEGFGFGTGTDKVGFSAKHSGDRGGLGKFNGLNLRSIFWTSTQVNSYQAYHYTLWAENDTIQRLALGSNTGFACRCVKNKINTAIYEKDKNDNDIFIYPNPAIDYIEISNKNYYNYPVTIYSVYGKKVYQSEGMVIGVDISNLSPGIYFLQTGGKNYKFVKIQ
jgi:uncharacterized protein (TIGR02145 family)